VASARFNCAVSQSCGSVALANQQRGQLLSVESLDTQYKEYFKRIKKCCHTKLLWWIKFMTKSKEGNFSSQPGWQEIMKFFSTYGFRIRPVFTQMGLWANGPYDFRGQGPLRTFTKRGVTDGKSLLGLPSSATVYSAQSFWIKHETQSDICIFSRTTSCRHLWQMACLCIHSGVCKKPHIANIILHVNIVLGPCGMSNHYPDQHNCGKFWPRVSPDLILMSQSVYK